MPPSFTSPATGSEVEIRGEVIKLHCSRPKFSAGVLRLEDGINIAPFTAPMQIELGDELTFRGQWVENKYGRQLKVRCLLYDADRPPDLKGLTRFLAKHTEIPGIGPSRAQSLVERFGADFDRVLREEPHAMAEAVGVPASVIQTLAEVWLGERATNAARTLLAGMGLGQAQIEAVIHALAADGWAPTVDSIRENPYVLVGKVRRFGFKAVDNIAGPLGITGDHPARLRTGVLSLVEDQLDRHGHCWVLAEDCLGEAEKLLAIDDRRKLTAAMDALIQSGGIVRVAAGDQTLLAVPRVYAAEAGLAHAFAHGRPNPHFAGTDVEDIVRSFAPDLDPDGQFQAVVMALQNGEMVMTGGAGSGKTYVCSTNARIHQSRNLKVILAAPTGKAARRLAEASGLPATTLHRLLGYDGQHFNAPAPLDADLIVVDESSMVDVELAWELRRRIDPGRTCVHWVGDANQLVPVGPGSLHRDLVKEDLVPVARLTKIVRQAGILRENCNALLRGEVRPKAEAEGDVQPWWVIDDYHEAHEIEQVIDRLYEAVLAERLNFDLVDDVQLVTPTHKGPLGTHLLNRRLQRIVQAKLHGIAVPEAEAGELPPLLAHDRVIQGRNNYATGIMNGEIGRVVGVEGRDAIVRFDTATVRYDPDLRVGDDLRLAYALTIHKAQGSEIPCSIVVVHRSSSFMMNRSLLYVGATRARTTAILIGGRRALDSAAARVEATRRRTFLSILKG